MWLALTVSVAGSTMVLVGQSESHGRTEAHESSTAGGDSLTVVSSSTDSTDSYDQHRDLIGVAMQCVSLLFSTGARLQMRLSEGERAKKV